MFRSNVKDAYHWEVDDHARPLLGCEKLCFVFSLQVLFYLGKFRVTLNSGNKSQSCGGRIGLRITGVARIDGPMYQWTATKFAPEPYAQKRSTACDAPHATLANLEIKLFSHMVQLIG